MIILVFSSVTELMNPLIHEYTNTRSEGSIIPSCFAGKERVRPI
jgi:hypothetical protein